VLNKYNGVGDLSTFQPNVDKSSIALKFN